MQCNIKTVLVMAENNSNKSNAKTSSEKELEPNPTFLHDFLGRNLLPTPVKAASGNDPSPAISDLSSDKQVIKHLEGVPFYGPGSGSDLTGSEMSNRSAGNKRNISDSVFMGTFRDGFPSIRAESTEGLHLMKMLRNAGAEHPRRAHDEGMFFGMNHLRPTSTPPLVGSLSGRSDPGGLRWDRAIPLNMGPTMQHAPPRIGQILPFSIHTPANKFKDGSIGPSGISQSAADEGSCTGIKRSGFLSSINSDAGVTDRVPSGVLLSGNIKNFGKPNCEPESSAAEASRQGLAPGGHQMTIFYGGQAHVFDDVHPSKAEVIMSVAGSNGGSWSTSYAKSAIPGTNESFKLHGGAASKHVTPGELRRSLSIAGSNTRGFGPGYQISVPSVAGSHHGSTTMYAEHGENVGKTGTVQKREV